MIDAETLALARLALKNAYYADFSKLVNNYVNAAKALDEDLFLVQIQEASSCYGVANTLNKGLPTITTRQVNGRVLHHEHLLNALQQPDAVDICINYKKVFEATPDGWQYTGD